MPRIALQLSRCQLVFFVFDDVDTIRGDAVVNPLSKRSGWASHFSALGQTSIARTSMSPHNFSHLTE